MAESKQCEFFLIRYAPDAVKEEFVNVGVVLLEQNGFAGVKFTRDYRRVKCLDAEADIEVLQELEKEIRAVLEDALACIRTGVRGGRTDVAGIGDDAAGSTFR